MLLNIEAERGRMQLTKQEIAKTLGVTTKTYNEYISKANPPTQALLKMSELFGCSVDYLVGLSDNRNRAS